MNESVCSHPNLICLNQFDPIRKYRCGDCGAVMMCACDEARGNAFLSHQLHQGTELETQDRVRVTDGFQPSVCVECRGLPPEAHPVASIFGRTSKIVRYYWRELFFREAELFEKWRRGQEGKVDEWDTVATEVKKRLHKVALEEIKALHMAVPKYRFSGVSQDETIRKYSVEIMNLQAQYVREVGQKRARVMDGSEAVPVEEFVKRHFERSGHQVMVLESRPFHVLFGVFLSLLIQDPADPKVRMVMFGDREAFEKKEPRREIRTFLPSDFGTPGYGVRRTREIEDFLADFPEEREELIRHFDYCVEFSGNFRQYLWAHGSEDVSKARWLLDVLPTKTVRLILRYLIDDYWGRYLGWPDLVVSQESVLKFVEVKSSNDKLSEDQQRWIADNHDILGLQFILAKVRR